MQIVTFEISFKHILYCIALLFLHKFYFINYPLGRYNVINSLFSSLIFSVINKIFNSLVKKARVIFGIRIFRQRMGVCFPLQPLSRMSTRNDSKKKLL